MQGMIIGAGIGGLVTAIALRKQNIDVMIYEAAAQLAPVGAGILVPPNAMNVLDRLGLAGKVAEAGMPIDSFAILDDTGKLISESSARFSANNITLPTVAIHRGALQNVFIQSLPAEIIKTGKRCTHVEVGIKGARAFFEDGTEQSSRFIIGADGLRSRVRQALFPRSTLRYSGQVCWRGVADMSLQNSRQKQLVEIWGAGKRFGFVPVDRERVYWFATRTTKAGWGADQDELKTWLSQLYAEFPEVVTELIACTPEAAILRDDINDLSPMKDWYRGAVVLIGDAAHATTPNLGQGGAQAMEDSWVLAQKMATCPNYEDAFRLFQQQRYARVRKIVSTSLQVARITNLSSTTLCKMRNLVLRSIPRAVTRKQTQMLYETAF